MKKMKNQNNNKVGQDGYTESVTNTMESKPQGNREQLLKGGRIKADSRTLEDKGVLRNFLEKTVITSRSLILSKTRLWTLSAKEYFSCLERGRKQRLEEKRN